MAAPWYQDFQSESIPEYVTGQGVTVRVIAGSSNGVTGVVTRLVTEPIYLDVHLPAGASFSTSLPASHNAFIYVYRGFAQIGETQVNSQQMSILSNNDGADGVLISAESDTRLILVAGKPLNESIVQYGPFVMNTQQEINQALDDFRQGRFA
jgi:redox-sensitive bicupin YhaK (pirin superfamily)